MKKVLKFKPSRTAPDLKSCRRRKPMKLDHATRFYLEYHKTNSGKNTIESYSATLSKFGDHIGNDRQLVGIS